MLWVKAFHIIFVVFWFAGLLYLPRLFVYHSSTTDRTSIERFKIMERRLFAITNVGAAGTIGFGTWLLADYGWAAYGGHLWLHLKLLLVAGLVLYHLWCGRLVRTFREERNRHGHRYYRLANEIPALALVAVVILVVVKQPL